MMSHIPSLFHRRIIVFSLSGEQYFLRHIPLEILKTDVIMRWERRDVNRPTLFKDLESYSLKTKSKHFVFGFLHEIFFHIKEICFQTLQTPYSHLTVTLFTTLENI